MPLPPAFISAIKANPDDDLPRLIAADWLDEHDEAEHAEFIRLECESAKISLRTSSRAIPEVNRRMARWRFCIERTAKLWVTHRGHWYPELQSLFDFNRTAGEPYRVRADTSRGFIEQVGASWSQWCRHADGLLAGHPVREVRLTPWPEDWARLVAIANEQWPGIAFPPPRHSWGDRWGDPAVTADVALDRFLNPPFVREPPYAP